MVRNQKSLWEQAARKNPLFYIASKFGKNITEEQFTKSGYEDYVTHIVQDSLVKRNGNALDLGCGNGRITEFMAKDFDFVIGIDISGEMIRLGKERLKDIQNIEFIENDGNKIPVPDESIDFVFSYIVFQHIKTYEMIKSNFKDVYRILKPGGVFKVLLRKKQEPLKWWNGGVAIDKLSYEVLCKLCGFEILKSTFDTEDYTYWLWLKK